MALYKSNKYKGLYEVEQMEEILKIMKIHGTGPKGNFEPFLSTLFSITLRTSDECLGLFKADLVARMGILD